MGNDPVDIGRLWALSDSVLKRIAQEYEKRVFRGFAEQLSEMKFPKTEFSPVDTIRVDAGAAMGTRLWAGLLDSPAVATGKYTESTSHDQLLKWY